MQTHPVQVLPHSGRGLHSSSLIAASVWWHQVGPDVEEAGEVMRCRIHPQSWVHRRAQLKNELELPQPHAGSISAMFPHLPYYIKLHMQKKNRDAT